MSSRPTVPGASPSVAADEVCTRRGRPTWAAARTAATAPSTLTRRIGSGSVDAELVDARDVEGSSAPSIPRASASTSSVSPRTTCAPRSASFAAAASERASADHLVAALHEPLDERAADHPAAAGDEDAAHEIERSEAENFSR